MLQLPSLLKSSDQGIRFEMHMASVFLRQFNQFLLERKRTQNDENTPYLGEPEHNNELIKLKVLTKSEDYIFCKILENSLQLPYMIFKRPEKKKV